MHAPYCDRRVKSRIKLLIKDIRAMLLGGRDAGVTSFPRYAKTALSTHVHYSLMMNKAQSDHLIPCVLLTIECFYELVSSFVESRERRGEEVHMVSKYAS